MSDFTWLMDFVAEASHRPWRLLRTIAMARTAELSTAAAVVDMVQSSEVKVFGYAALAQRDPRQRETFLAQAAAETSGLEDPVARAGVLLAVVDRLPTGNAAHFSQMLKEEIIPTIEGSARRQYEALFQKRAPLVGRAHAGLFQYADPVGQALYARLEPEELATEFVHIYGKTASKMVRGIRPIGMASRKEPVRLKEIGSLLRIDPQTFEIVATPQQTLAKARSLRATDDAISEVPLEASKSTPKRPERVVNTGFADVQGNIVHIVADPSKTYRYFIDIGERIEEALDSDHELPKDLGPGVIEVVMFVNGDGLRLEGPNRGTFRIDESGRVTVDKPAASVPGDWSTRMFFAFRTPETNRVCSMRCSFYCRGTLVQSRRITIPVGSGSEPTINPDYVLSRTLSPRYLAQLHAPRLSLMLNGNADGTHTLRFYGDGRDFGNGSTFGEGELTDRIDKARASLRLTAWGTKQEWDQTRDRYRYRTPQTVQSLLKELCELAWSGSNLWATTISKLAGGRDEGDALTQLMQKHGTVHLALKESPSHILPIALFYDYEFDPDVPKHKRKLCPSFRESLAAADLATEPCFIGDCPSRTKGDTICPSGFWGFRHAIGLPPSIGAQQSSPAEFPPVILTSGAAFVTAGVSTDPKMSSRFAHLRRMRDKMGVSVEAHETRDNTVAALMTSNAPLVYFYCHGGLHDKEGPFIQVGPVDGPRIAYRNVRKVRWEKPRPIVFINGCHTTAVSPEQAFSLVQAFVAESSATGVIGTEITIFESLATSFAETFYQEFVVNKRAVGEAVRRSRLSLLHRWRNPLGLVYIPFVLPDVHVWPREQS